MITLVAANHTFVFADLAGYTALTEAHGDEGGAGTAIRLFEITRRALSPISRLVKTLGDGVMVVADSEEEGIRVAMAIARSVRIERGFPAIRIGVHSGAAEMDSPMRFVWVHRLEAHDAAGCQRGFLDYGGAWVTGITSSPKLQAVTRPLLQPGRDRRQGLDRLHAFETTTSPFATLTR